MTKMPLKVIFELKDVKMMETVISAFEKVRDTHPDTIMNAEIRVRPKN